MPVTTLPLLFLLREGPKEGEEGLTLWTRCYFGRRGRRWERWPQQHRWVKREGEREGGREGMLHERQQCIHRFAVSSIPPSLPPSHLSLQLTAEAIYDFSEVPLATAVTAEEEQVGTRSHSFSEGAKLNEGGNLLPSPSFPPSLPPLYTGGRSPSDLFYSEHVNDIHALLGKAGADSYVERMDLEDYLFRFDRGVFWFAQVSVMS